MKGKRNISFIELYADVPEMPVISTFPLIHHVSNTEEMERALRSNAAVISLDGSPEAKPGLMDYGFVGEVLEALSSEH